MEMNAYQAAAKETAVFPPDSGIVYTALGLVSEGGEVADKIKKIIRDQGGEFSDEAREAIKKELGDVLWYVAGLAWELGFTILANMYIDPATAGTHVTCGLANFIRYMW